MSAVVFFLTALAFFSIFFSTLWLGISPMPSNRRVIQEVVQLIPKGFSGTLVDLGSGWGTVCNTIAKKFPKARVIGVEVSLIPFFISKICKRKNVEIRFQDFRSKIPTGEIYFAYLFPGGMKSLSDKLPSQGTLISNSFALPNLKPVQTIMTGRFYKTPIYVYSWIFEKSSS